MPENFTTILPDGWTEEAIEDVRSRQMGVRILHGPDGQRLVTNDLVPWVLSDPATKTTRKTLDWDLGKSLRKVDKIYLAQRLAHVKNDLFAATMGDPLDPILRAEARRDEVLVDIAFMGFDADSMTTWDEATGLWVVA